jgi:SAM-dependent methyltransferase
LRAAVSQPISRLSRPAAADRVREQTKYLDESLHADAGMSACRRRSSARRFATTCSARFLAPERHDIVVDLGCGSGRALLWNREWGSTNVGIDISPFFSADARRDVDLLIGDLRKLPFADATFTKAFSLDVLEHLSPEALRAHARGEPRGCSRPAARCSSTRTFARTRRSPWGLRWINALARRLEAWGLVDMRQERLRKSDHLNPLRDIPELEQVVREAGFRIGRIRYYTPLVGGFVENILMRWRSGR